jgi:hypothetical protein
MELLKDKVASLYVEYKEFEKVVKAKNEALYKDKANLKEVVEGKTVEELQQVLVHTYVDTILYNKDLQILFFKLIVSIETFLEVVGQGLQEDIQNFYKNKGLELKKEDMSEIFKTIKILADEKVLKDIAVQILLKVL